MNIREQYIKETGHSWARYKDANGNPADDSTTASFQIWLEELAEKLKAENKRLEMELDPTASAFLQDRIDELEAEVESMKREIETLNAKNEVLRKEAERLAFKLVEMEKERGILIR